jgi:hypothetical protein
MRLTESEGRMPSVAKAREANLMPAFSRPDGGERSLASVVPAFDPASYYKPTASRRAHCQNILQLKLPIS